MIEFELDRVLEESDWENVTVGMAMDEIEYTIKSDQHPDIEMSDSLPTLIALYGCAYCEVSSEEHPYNEVFRVVDSDYHVELTRWNMNETIRTTYIELEHELEQFLAEVFRALDVVSEPDEREQAFEFMTQLTEFDFPKLYQRLININS